MERNKKGDKKMGIINKILVGALILLVAVFIVQSAQASGCPRITYIDVSYDMISYTGAVKLENTGDENITVVVVIYADEYRTHEQAIDLNIEYFKCYRIRTSETVYFEAPCEEGKHEVHVTVIVDNMSLLGNVSYIAQGCIRDMDEEEEETEMEEEVEDWLECLCKQKS
jgi:hypothetical protein